MALTCQQLITRACTDAAVPGYTAQAADKLNLILAELAILYDWDILRTTGPNISVVAGVNQYTVPQDYLRARQLFYFINGQSFFVNQLPLEQFNGLFQGPGAQTYPEWFSSDLSPLQNNPATQPFILLWPTPAMSITLQYKYFRQPPDYANAATSSAVPWFPFQQYLLWRLTGDLMNSSADSRGDKFVKMAEDWLGKYGKLANDQEGYAVTVKKDPRNFRQSPLDSRATKAIPL